MISGTHRGTRLGLAVAPLIAALLAAAPASAHRIEKHFPVEGRPVVIVHNAHGRIQVSSWKKAEVVVVGNHATEKAEVDTEQAGNRIEITTRSMGDNLPPAQLSATYEITVPEETELQVKTDSGTILIERVVGDLMIDTLVGNVQLEEVAGYIVIKSVEGSIVCTRCAGRIDATTLSGNIQVLQPVFDTVRVQTTSGNILFDGNLVRRGVYILKNSTGATEVRLSENDSFDLSAKSVSGQVENLAKFNLRPDPHGSTRAPGPPSKLVRSLFGTVNEGHARVELSSFSGTIRIVKRD